MNEEKLEVELERLAKLLRQLPEVEEEVDRCEEALDAARSNVEYVRSGIAEVRARVCNLLMPPNIVVAGPALTPVSEEKDEGLLADQQDTPPQSNAQASETDAPAWMRFDPSEGWHTHAGVRDYEYFTFLEGVKFEMAIVGGERVIVTSRGPGVPFDEPVRNVEAYRIISEPVDAFTAAERTSVVTDHDRVDQTPTDTVAAVEIPEGFIPWSGGECPVEDGTDFDILDRQGLVHRHNSNSSTRSPAYWIHLGDPHDIIAYRLISEPAKASEAPSELKTQAEVGGDRVAPHDLPALSDEAFNALPKLDDTAVIDAEPPTIPRSEIPEGVAVETFTEQGVETVKIGGLTHIVEGEAPVEKFSATRDGGEAGFWAAARGLTKIEEMA